MKQKHKTQLTVLSVFVTVIWVCISLSVLHSQIVVVIVITVRDARKSAVKKALKRPELTWTLFVCVCVIQTKLYELEGQVRRGAAERGIAEMKKNEFQEEIQRQKEQISHIESLYKRQLEGAQNTCSQEKVHMNTAGT